MKKTLLLLSMACGLNLFAADCPTDQLKGFDGTFKGVLSSVSFEGKRQPQQNLVETHTVTSCAAFDVDIHYSNPTTGQETREVKFSARWDENQKGFVFAGPLIDGVFRIVRPGAQFVVHFNTKFAGNPAQCDEMMSLASSGKQIVRSVQCFADAANGPSLGVRTALATKVP